LSYNHRLLEESGFTLSTPCCQVVADRNKVPLSFFSLGWTDPALAAALRMQCAPALKSSWWPWLDSPRDLIVCLILENPRVGTVLQMR